jgi:predicted nucleic acid-binding protein
MLPPSCIPQDLLFAVARIGAESAVGRPLSRPIVVLRNYQLHSATIARAGRIASAPTEGVEEKVRWLTLGGLQIVAADETVGLLAGRLHARHYHRTRRPLSLADCIALAIALSLGQRLATSDPALLGAAADEGCPYRVFLDARVRRASVAAIPDEGSTSP